MSRQSRNPPRMSLEQALEEERREVLEIIEGPRRSSSTSEKDNRNVGATSHVRNFLEIPSAPPPSRRGSIAGSGVGITPSSRGHGVRKSTERVPSSPLRLTLSASSTPTTEDSSLFDSPGHLRRSSDDTDLASNETQQTGSKRQGVDFEKEYRFDMQPSTPNPNVRKAGQSRRSAKISGLEIRVLPNFARGRDSVRRSGSARGMSLEPKSPSGLEHSLSPVNRWLNSSPFNLGAKPGKISTEKGKPCIDMDRHLSDDALAKSSGNLTAPAKPGSDPASQGDGRLQKDVYDSEDNPLDSSGDEVDLDDLSSSDDDATRRGFRKDAWGNMPSTKGGDDADPSKAPCQPQTLLEAAEEERKMVEEENKGKLPVEPEPLRSALANADKQTSKTSSVHPQTNYECSTSTANTPFGSDDEADMSDIKRAQQLSIQLSALDHSVRHRTVRSIVRGNFASADVEAEEGRRRQRKYLVATDLSEESVYALEWTIGTILRDGDTMIAVYASHDEREFSRETEGGGGGGGGGGAKANSHDGGASQVEEEGHLPRAFFGRFGGAAGPDNKSGSGDSHHHLSKTGSERIHAVDALTQTCVRLLRKTLLQVRISVEVINCKSPKHMITEAIDRLVPTMVIVGARGQGALKGVLLGSFSNYLVNKSSVPVMVARKKLKTQPKQKKNNPRLSNNLTTPKKLSLAKVD